MATRNTQFQSRKRDQQDGLLTFSLEAIAPLFSRARPKMDQGVTSWKNYFNVDRVLEISSQFNQLMDGWKIDGTVTKTAFDDFYRRKMKKIYRPKIINSSVLLKPKQSVEKIDIKPEKTVKLHKKDKKKKKEKKMPPKVIIPAPKRRKEEDLVEPVELEKIPTIRIPKAQPKPSSKAEELDVYEPILMVTGRPSTQLHFAKLCRFALKLKEEGRQLPFLLRNIVVEESEEEQLKQ